MQTLFISDLHLCNERPEKLTLFKKLLRGPARKVNALYILGDLFEAWAGDDDDTPPHPDIISELAEYTASGASLYIMRGNRDYLLGRNFARETGGQLIDDRTIIELHGKKTLLMHGDTLCTRDVKYQIYRRIVNNNFAIRLFLAIPFPLRVKMWHGIRTMTRENMLHKSPDIIDIHQPEVEKTMLQYGVFELIHGHTHKQGIHKFTLNGHSASRFVLGDWYEGDCVLVSDESGLRMMRVQEYLNSNS